MNIYEKMLEVMKEVQYLSKDDKVEFKTTKYKAISEEKVTTAVRKSLVQNGLVIFPVKQEHKKVDNLTTVDVTYRIVNTEKPDETLEVVSSGTGVDTQDKGVGKAMTYAYKYMLLRTFAIPTGEDPDKISSDEIDDKTKAKATAMIDEIGINALRKEIERTGAKEKAVCYQYKIKKLEDMTFGQFEHAMKLLSDTPDKIDPEKMAQAETEVPFK